MTHECSHMTHIHHHIFLYYTNAIHPTEATASTQSRYTQLQPLSLHTIPLSHKDGH